MRKLAIFVEGQTEQIFVKKLLSEIAGSNNIVIDLERAAKSRKGSRTFTGLFATRKIDNKKYYVLIRDCGSETTVKSDIVDSLPSLNRENYEMIIGLRDVYPLSYSDIPKLKKHLNYGVPTRFMPVYMVLAIMEIESWFLGETTHYKRIDPALTLTKIKSQVGFDPSVDDVERISHPSVELDKIYKIVHKAYKKDRLRVQRTVDVFDYAEIYLNLKSKISSLREFINRVDLFME